MVEESLQVDRGFLWKLLRGMAARGEGVVAAVQHALGVVQVVGACLGAKVGEHGIGFPTAEKGNVVGVDVGAQQGGGSPWAERAGGEELGVDAGESFKAGGSLSQGCGDVGRADVAPLLEVWIVVVANRGVGRSASAEEEERDAAEGLSRTVEGVGVGTMADFSPRLQFFWSVNVSVAWEMARILFTSFRGVACGPQ